MSSPTLSLYDLTVPLFTKQTQQLQHYIQKAEQWSKDNSKDPSTLTQARLIEDMQPLGFQIQTCYRMIIYLFQNLDIAADLPKDSPAVPQTLREVYTQLDQLLKLLEGARREKFDGKEGMAVSFGPPGRDPWRFTGLGFVQEFILPNFFFHSTTAYNILRMSGVPLGKLDFLGPVGQ